MSKEDELEKIRLIFSALYAERFLLQTKIDASILKKKRTAQHTKEQLDKMSRWRRSRQN